MDNVGDKVSLRRSYLKKRLMFDKNKAKELSKIIAGNFIDNIDINKISSVAGYYPISGEVDILTLMQLLNNLGIKISMPVVKEKKTPLIFRLWEDNSKMEHVNKYNIKQPNQEMPEVIPDLIIVPLLAFDKKGYRLGYGEGYYDRTISYLKEIGNKFITVGVAFSFQYNEQIPIDEYDQKLDYIVTEEEFIKVL